MASNDALHPPLDRLADPFRLAKDAVERALGRRVEQVNLWLGGRPEVSFTAAVHWLRRQPLTTV